MFDSPDVHIRADAKTHPAITCAICAQRDLLPKEIDVEYPTNSVEKGSLPEEAIQNSIDR